jgi:outer membrane murein-binding lipoprotein Lpp
MSDQPRDLTFERIKRFTEAVADLMESHTPQGRNLARLLDLQGQQLGRIEVALNTLSSDVRGLATHVHDLASEQVLLGNRVENAFSKALRANIRLDDIEEAAR